MNKLSWLHLDAFNLPGDNSWMAVCNRLSLVIAYTTYPTAGLAFLWNAVSTMISDHTGAVFPGPVWPLCLLWIGHSLSILMGTVACHPSESNPYFDKGDEPEPRLRQAAGRFPACIIACVFCIAIMSAVFSAPTKLNTLLFWLGIMISIGSSRYLTTYRKKPVNVDALPPFETGK